VQTFKRFHLQPIVFDNRKNKNSKNNSETIPQTPLLPKLAPENRPSGREEIELDDVFCQLFRKQLARRME
jgi:hypothetical protein